MRTHRTFSVESLEDRNLLTTSGFLPGDDVAEAAYGSQQHVAISPGGDGYLAVWTDDRAVLSGFTNAPGNPLSGNMRDIYGQRLDAQGNAIGPVIIVSSQGMNQQSPAVAWNESAQAWLVAYQTQDPDWYFDDQILGVRVSATGAILDSEPILFFDDAQAQGPHTPNVASDGSNWVVGTDQFVSASLRSYAVRVDPMGTILDNQPVQLASADLQVADLAFADGVFMAVARHRVNGAVSTFRFNSQLTTLGNVTSVDNGTPTVPAIASNGIDEFFVVADRAYRFGTDGQNLTPGGITYEHGSDFYSFAEVAWSGSDWVVATYDDSFFSEDIRMQRFDASGTALDATPVIVEADINAQQAIGIAARDTGDVVFIYPSRANPFYNVHTAHLSPQGALSQPVDVSVGLARQSFAKLIEGPNNENLVIFVRQTDAASEIVGQRITDAGVPLDAEPFLIESVLAGATGAWNGSEYLVIWDDPNTGNVVGKRIDAATNVLDATPITIADEAALSGFYFAGDVAAANGTFVVGLIQYIGFHEPVQYAEFVRVDGATGTLIDATPHSITTSGHARHMTAASYGDKVILAWAQFGRHDSTAASVDGAIIDESASVTGHFDISQQRGEVPTIAVNGNQALVVWHDNTTIYQDDIEGRFVMSDGTLAPAEFVISDAANEQMFADVAWTGDDYIVAWNDYRHVTGVQQLRSDIWTTRVQPDGTVLDTSGTQISNSAIPEDLPTVAGGGGNGLIVYSALNGVANIPAVQRLAFHSDATSLLGDFDANGNYDIDDLDALTTAVVNAGPIVDYDLNGDNALDINDVILWRELAGDTNLGPGLAYLPADANLDGSVDGTDFLAWNAKKFTASSNWSNGDFNVDGIVDGRDFLIWNQHKFSSAFPVTAKGDAENEDDEDRDQFSVDEVFATFDPMPRL